MSGNGSPPIGVIGFLKTPRSKEELAAALAVLRDFKGRESTEEWLAAPFSTWTKLEQLEEYLDHLVNGAPLKDDTLACAKRLGMRL